MVDGTRGDTVAGGFMEEAVGDVAGGDLNPEEGVVQKNNRG